jgi:periplasmic protein TonB
MKQFVFLACLIMFSCKIFANDTLFFRIPNRWRPVKNMGGNFVRKVIPAADSGFLALDYNGTDLIGRGYYSDTSFTVNLYCHYYYNPDKGFPQEIKCYDSVGDLTMHAELNKDGDTIWRQSFSNEEVIGSKVFPEYESDRTIFFSMLKPAVFPGGYTNWKKFVTYNMKYPKDAKKQRIQGSVTVEFVVSKGGKITNAKVIASANALLDNEALRLISSSPDWLPAEENGIKIDFTQRQLIVFKL